MTGHTPFSTAMERSPISRVAVGGSTDWTMPRTVSPENGRRIGVISRTR